MSLTITFHVTELTACPGLRTCGTHCNDYTCPRPFVKVNGQNSESPSHRLRRRQPPLARGPLERDRGLQAPKPPLSKGGAPKGRGDSDKQNSSKKRIPRPPPPLAWFSLYKKSPRRGGGPHCVYRLFRNRRKASLPSGVRLYTPACSSTWAKTRPASFWTISKAFSLVMV